MRGLFLNDSDRLRALDGIGRHAAYAQDAIQRQDYPAFLHAVRNSWTLNQELDHGTKPPEVQRIIDQCGSDRAACKLASADGGGYLFLLARDPDALRAVRRRLTASPPNARARFVDFFLSDRGLQITRS